MSMDTKVKTVDYSSKEYFDKMTAYWRAANYVSVGQLYLKDNPLLERPLKSEDVKPHPIGHWGTIAGQNFIYTHLNRVINKYDLNSFILKVRVMVARSWFPTPTSMVRIQRFIHGFPRIKKG